MKLSARNVLKGKVKSIIEGAVNDEVVLELPGGQEVVAVITEDLGAEPRAGQGEGRLRGNQGQQRHAGRRVNRNA